VFDVLFILSSAFLSAPNFIDIHIRALIVKKYMPKIHCIRI